MQTKTLKKLDKQYVWHPFTQMKEWSYDEMLVMEEGKDCYLKDSDGNWYLDGISSLWVNVHGHRNCKIDQAIKNQIDHLGHSTLLGFSNTPSILLAQKLVEITPEGLDKVFYSDSGSEAVEIALKIAFQYWRHKNEHRKYFIRFKNTYHGDTIGSVSVGGMKLFHDIFGPLLFKTLEAPWPHTYWKPENMSLQNWKNFCLLKLENILKTNRNKIAGIITEPLIQGASGMSLAPAGFLKETEKLCRKYDTLLIVDEVATGFGRTGKMFACEWEKVHPSIMCIAKGLTGGYLPLAATLASSEIFKAFLGDYKEYKTFFHGHTYTGNPLGCAAALANLQLFKTNRTLDKLKKKIAHFKRCLSVLKKHPHVGDIRQSGFMVGIELIKNKKKQTPYLLNEKIGVQVCRMARKYFVILRPLGNVIVLMPPLIIKTKDLTYLTETVSKCIDQVTLNKKR